MRRQIARFLQKRKFRLIIRWKEALKHNLRTPPPLETAFPFALLFPAFDEILDSLRKETSATRFDHDRPLLAHLGTTPIPSADHYMEMFISGRDVLINFCTSDPVFLISFSEQDRRTACRQCELAFRHLIDRDMPAHARCLARERRAHPARSLARIAP